jgi:hypothetical protein
MTKRKREMNVRRIREELETMKKWNWTKRETANDKPDMIWKLYVLYAGIL